MQEKLENNSKLCNERGDFMNPDLKKNRAPHVLKKVWKKIESKSFRCKLDEVLEFCDKEMRRCADKLRMKNVEVLEFYDKKMRFVSNWKHIKSKKITDKLQNKWKWMNLCSTIFI